jgi:hypothetical protein
MRPEQDVVKCALDPLACLDEVLGLRETSLSFEDPE